MAMVTTAVRSLKRLLWFGPFPRMGNSADRQPESHAFIAQHSTQIVTMRCKDAIRLPL